MFGKLSPFFGFNVSQPIPSGNLFLDTYTGAVAAYSVRKLSSSYSGNALRVVRTSDNATLDIGFVGNDIDESAISTFCAGTTGRVSIWYDQSGNAKHATQSGNLPLPLIFSSGSLVKTNNKLALRTTTNEVMAVPTTAYTNLVGVAKFESNNTVNYLTWDGPSGAQGGGFYFGGAFTSNVGLGGFDGTNFNHLGLTSSQVIINEQIISSRLNAAYNNNSYTDLTAFKSALNLDWLFGRGGSNGLSFGGTVQEMIFYNTNNSSNKSGMTTNINSYYSVY